jgi:hypothetical protein
MLRGAARTQPLRAVLKMTGGVPHLPVLHLGGPPNARSPRSTEGQSAYLGIASRKSDGHFFALLPLLLLVKWAGCGGRRLSAGSAAGSVAVKSARARHY